MKSTEILSSITYWNHVLRYGLEQGLDLSEFQQPNIKRHGDFVSFDDFSRLLLRMKQDLALPGLGLELARRVEMSTHGSLGFAVSHSRNLKECIELIGRYYKTRMQAVKVGPFVEGSIQVLQVSPACEWGPVRQIIYDAVLLTLFNVVSYAIGNEASRCSIEFPYAQPPDLQRYRELINGEIHFGAENGAIHIPLDLMDMLLISSNPRSLDLGKNQCEVELATLQQYDSVAQKVRELIEASDQFSASVESVASALHVSKSTLIRRLKSENMAFSKIQEKLKKEQAAHLLTATQLTIEVVAMQLGYDDSSNFGRSFKRWYGCSPKQYRADSK